MVQQRERPLPAGRAAAAIAGCALRAGALLAGGRIHQPRERVGLRLGFADGTSARVYRETVVDRPPPERPAVLVVGFRLRVISTERSHALFRAESELNTGLFVGFRGFASKLWLRHDAGGRYRGVYEWDDARLAVLYVRALWWLLRPVSDPGTFGHAVLPGLRRDALLRDPSLVDPAAAGDPDGWWRLSDAGGPAR